MLFSPQILVRRPPKVGGDSAAYTNFIARTSGLNGTHLTAYQGLLNGMTTDGLFDSSGNTTLFDAIYIFATQDSTTARLNLCSSSFGVLNSSSLTFTADSGFTGDSTPNHYLDTQFNPSTAGSPKYTQNSAHLSLWNLTNNAEGIIMIAAVASASTGENLYPKFSDNNIYARLNDNPESGGFSISDPRGHILMNRSSSTARQLYQNASTTLSGGTAATYGSTSSQAVLNSNISILGTDGTGSSRLCAMASIGASLNSTQVTNFYNRLRTYMTAVGVP